MEKVKDLPVDFKLASSQSDLYNAPHTLSFTIRIRWIDNLHAYVSIWRQEYPGGQGDGTHADVEYESGRWRFYDSHHVTAIN
jgi:hypothetical protein